MKDEKATYSNPLLKLCHWKYATESILVKSYKKYFELFVVKTVRDITNNLLKLTKVFFTTANASVYSIASQCSGDLKVCEIFASTKNC